MLARFSLAQQHVRSLEGAKEVGDGFLAIPALGKTGGASRNVQVVSNAPLPLFDLWVFENQTEAFEPVSVGFPGNEREVFSLASFNSQTDRIKYLHI
jgi:hypothetical protein